MADKITINGVTFSFVASPHIAAGDLLIGDSFQQSYERAKANGMEDIWMEAYNELFGNQNEEQ